MVGGFSAASLGGRVPETSGPGGSSMGGRRSAVVIVVGERWKLAPGDHSGDSGGVGSGSPVVFVDDAAKNVTALNLADVLSVVAWCRAGKVESPMRASLVVVPDVVGKHRFEVLAGHNEEMVETVFSDGSHPALGKRVRPASGPGCESS
jgi:hypothetical protein